MKEFSNPVIAEIGVFEGDLSFSTLLHCNPSNLLLIDPYRHYKANRDLIKLDLLEQRFNRVYEKSKSYSSVNLLRSTLQDLDREGYFSELNSSVDIFYIDGDHSYSAALSDLEISAKYLSSNGLIFVDDYIPGIVEYGIIKAVNEFLGSHADFYIYGLNYNQLVLRRAI